MRCKRFIPTCIYSIKMVVLRFNFQPLTSKVLSFSCHGIIVWYSVEVSVSMCRTASAKSNRMWFQRHYCLLRQLLSNYTFTSLTNQSASFLFSAQIVNPFDKFCKDKKSGLYVDETSRCVRYIHCYNGRTYSMRCAHNTVFNPVHRRCDHIHNVPTCMGYTG